MSSKSTQKHCNFLLCWDSIGLGKQLGTLHIGIYRIVSVIILLQFPNDQSCCHASLAIQILFLVANKCSVFNLTRKKVQTVIIQKLAELNTYTILQKRYNQTINSHLSDVTTMTPYEIVRLSVSL